MKNILIVSFVSVLLAGCTQPCIHTTTIKPLEGEKWWGAIINDGYHQPYSDVEETDLASVNKGGATAPLFVSSCGRYVWSDRPFSYSFKNGVMTIRSKTEKVQPTVAGTTLREAYLAACKAHFQFTGGIPPKEFFEKPQFNNWIEIFLRGINQQVVDEYTDAIAANGFPCGVYMMDGGYLKHMGSMSFEDSLFPDPTAMFDRIHSHGWKSIIWMAYFVSPDSREYKKLRYHAQHSTLDLLVHRRDNNEAAVIRWWSGISAAYDLTNPEGYKYYSDELKSFLERYHIDGFKFDAGDPRFFTESGDYRFHTPELEAVDYSTAYNRLAFEFPYNEYRSGFRCGGWPIVQRLHDKAHSWEDLKQISPEIQMAGLMGSPYVVGDMIGGGLEVSFIPLKGEIDHKLFVRSCELQALMPMMQFSLAPWRVLTKEECDICRDMAGLHVEFSPYIIELAEHAAETGEPIVRSMEYEYPHQGFNRPMQQFMLGARYLVAPVVDADDSVTVELPEGEWKDDLGEIHHGPVVLNLTDVPLERLPYYEKQNR